MVHWLDLNRFSYVWFIVMINASVVGCFLLGGVLMITRYSKRISAGSRFLLLFLSLSSLLAFPFISGLIPAGQTNPTPSYPMISKPDIIEKAPVPNYMKPGIYLKDTVPKRNSLTYLTGFFLIWGLGFLIMGLRILAGILGMYRLLFIMRNQDQASIGLYPGMIMKIADRTGFHTPATCGLLRPIVILPTGVMEWPAAQKQAVLHHEAAHIKRYDNLTNLLAQIIVAVYWFNPLAWIALNELRINREKACDDYVLNAGVKPSLYAGILLESIRTNTRMYFKNENLIALQFHSKGEKRLNHILDDKIQHNLLQSRIKLLILLISLLLIIPLSAVKLLGADEPNAIQVHISHLDSRPVIIIDGYTLKMTFTDENNLPIDLSGPRTEFPISWPEKNSHSRIAKPFGFFFHPIFKKQTHHEAVDIVSPFRTPIVATADGTVTIAKFWEGYGKCIEIQHHYFSTRYGHLDEINVTPGDIVKQGEIIGYSGNTGYSTGPHLHYEIRYDSKALNPEYFFNASLEQ